LDFRIVRAKWLYCSKRNVLHNKVRFENFQNAISPIYTAPIGYVVVGLIGGFWLLVWFGLVGPFGGLVIGGLVIG
jgi:hypothetical protein